MNREAVEKAVRDHAPEWWGRPDIDHMVSYVDDPIRPDRDEIAHDMWAMGAGPEHEGCRYGGPDPADADYENECETCRAWLLGAADKILAAFTTDREVGSQDG